MSLDGLSKFVEVVLVVALVCCIAIGLAYIFSPQTITTVEARLAASPRRLDAYRLFGVFVLAVAATLGVIMFRLFPSRGAQPAAAPRPPASGVSHVAQPVPAPSATGCAFFAQLYPPTKEAFAAHHLSAAQRTEVLKWTAQIPASDRRYARWMVEPWKGSESALLIFDAKPVFVANGGISPWTALNTNVVADPRTCFMGAYPKA